MSGEFKLKIERVCSVFFVGIFDDFSWFVEGLKIGDLED
jgi:hypothetical protein